MLTCLRYNTLLDDCDQPPVAEKHIKNLSELFVRHNAEKVLGIHLIHGHFKIPVDTVMVGINFENDSIRWTNTTSIDSIDPTSVHGHIYTLTKDGLCAYEFQDGPLPNLSGVGQDFLAEFTDYILENDLANLIGLQVLGCASRAMEELILDHGTVMLDASITQNTVPTRITGWRFESFNGKPRVCTMNESHVKTVKKTHKVYYSGKLGNIGDLKMALNEAGVLRMD